MHVSDVRPHALPGEGLDGEPGPVHVKEYPAVLLLLLTWRPGAVACRGRGRLLPAAGTVAEEAVGAGALGPAVPAQLDRRRAGPAGGVRPGHRSQVQPK